MKSKALVLPSLQDKDSYGNEVTHIARPLPVEYLLVPIPAAFASDFHYTFKSNTQMESFPVENRENAGQRQVKHPYYIVSMKSVNKIANFEDVM